MKNTFRWDHAMDPEFEARLQRDIKKRKYQNHKHNKKFVMGIRVDDKQRCPKTKKVCYSKKDANTIINNPIRLKKVPVRVYICDYCGSYHLTSKKAKNPPSNTEK